MHVQLLQLNQSAQMEILVLQFADDFMYHKANDFEFKVMHST